MAQELDSLSINERQKQRKLQATRDQWERPNQMRPKVVDSYIRTVLQQGHEKRMIRVIERMYKLNMDNRVLNNLRAQLNDMIEDERGLCTLNQFNSMFFSFFKGDPNAKTIYEMLEPCVTIFYDALSNKEIKESEAKPEQKFIKIQLLTKFIDLYNFFPLRVYNLKHKNTSDEMTQVMSSGIQGYRDKTGELIKPKPVPKTEEEVHLHRLLAVVSDKITELFPNLQQCFRFLDSNHNQSLSLNEFAQAIENLRLKLDFDDVKKLFQYMDTNASGEIGYEEFTMLLEERWRGIDPILFRTRNEAFLQQQRSKGALDHLFKSDEERSKVLETIAIQRSKLKQSQLKAGLTDKITRMEAETPGPSAMLK